MGFLKFQDNAKRDKAENAQLHWHRAELDGAPFRGDSIPLLKNDEFEELAQKVHDAKIGIFDTSDETHKQCGRTYNEVLDGVASGWFKLLTERKYKWSRRNKKLTMLVYVEWSEPTMQLPSSVTKHATK